MFSSNVRDYNKLLHAYPQLPSEQVHLVDSIAAIRSTLVFGQSRGRSLSLEIFSR